MPAGNGHQLLMMAAFTAHPQESVFQATALEIVIKFPNYIREQRRALKVIKWGHCLADDALNLALHTRPGRSKRSSFKVIVKLTAAYSKNDLLWNWYSGESSGPLALSGI